jgi:hypothetical protein
MPKFNITPKKNSRHVEKENFKTPPHAQVSFFNFGLNAKIIPLSPKKKQHFVQEKNW